MTSRMQQEKVHVAAMSLRQLSILVNGPLLSLATAQLWFPCHVYRNYALFVARQTNELLLLDGWVVKRFTVDGSVL